MHQIEIKIIKARSSCRFNGGQGLSAIVNTTQFQQMLIVKTLDAYGQAIDPGTAEAAEFFLLCGARIGF